MLLTFLKKYLLHEFKICHASFNQKSKNLLIQAVGRARQTVLALCLARTGEIVVLPTWRADLS